MVLPVHVQASLTGQVFLEATQILQDLALNISTAFVTLLPNLFAALIVVVAGWVVGKVLGFVLSRALSKAKLDHWIHQHGLGQALYGKRLSAVLGGILKWYIVLLFLSQAVELVRLSVLTTFLAGLVFYLPALIGSILVLIAGLLVGEYVKRMILDSQVANKELVGNAAKVVVVYFTLVTALQTAGFNVTIFVDAFRIGFAALAAALAIAVGISFGFAFRKDAEQLVREFRKRAGK